MWDCSAQNIPHRHFRLIVSILSEVYSYDPLCKTLARVVPTRCTCAYELVFWAATVNGQPVWGFERVIGLIIMPSCCSKMQT